MEESNKEKYITLPNGKQISVEDYFDIIIDENFVFGMYKLKTEDGKTESISYREFIERFIDHSLNQYSFLDHLFKPSEFIEHFQ